MGELFLAGVCDLIHGEKLGEQRTCGGSEGIGERFGLREAGELQKEVTEKAIFFPGEGVDKMKAVPGELLCGTRR